mmetsp:Transcript_29426/g.74048  ORF Transcript_29426/g.74048 Transcript_29426/m.74048 type:complete len:115 (+) Transcript_29426:76-420(+)|eukprot:CAMPEP_0177651358 /NCGR_PEP_ID=MMETSP0447-20121125/12499_1 /TAXON_ID=0 /ORGANISM="Stygamoeba regulata, Strain BSH-02190019" /LENGTH=114 /DNA_ID=CAMNT_0019154421 /DNA_START=59 /DNA_END=403 /DNA_ORIENTATION=-
MSRGNSSQAGIQQLLQAEQRAQEIVNQARKEKAALVKKARDEAEAEVNKYREERLKQFDDYSSTRVGSTDEYAKKLAIETEQNIAAVQTGIQSKKQEVIDMLLKSVANASLEVK